MSESHPVLTTSCKDLKKQKDFWELGTWKYKCKLTFVRILCIFVKTFVTKNVYKSVLEHYIVDN